jgi:hypothetical protein
VRVRVKVRVKVKVRVRVKVRGKVRVRVKVKVRVKVRVPEGVEGLKSQVDCQLKTKNATGPAVRHDGTAEGPSWGQSANPEKRRPETGIGDRHNLPSYLFPLSSA